MRSSRQTRERLFTKPSSAHAEKGKLSGHGTEGTSLTWSKLPKADIRPMGKRTQEHLNQKRNEDLALWAPIRAQTTTRHNHGINCVKVGKEKRKIHGRCDRTCRKLKIIYG